jgi:NADH:ubiquinone oxidoreductase subunit C
MLYLVGFFNIFKVLPLKYIFSDSKFLFSINIHYINLLINFFFLRQHQQYRFKVLSTISCVDYPELEDRFEVIYTLMSLDFPLVLNLKLKSSEYVYINSSSIYFKSAVWLEREIWDMFGIYFINNFDLRRILTDYGFPYHPLRKTFPLQGYSQITYQFVAKRMGYTPNVYSQIKATKIISSIWNKVF